MNNRIARHLLVVDQLRVEEAAAVCATNALNYGYLYIGTVWDHQRENSPIWIEVNQDDAGWKAWLSDPLWANSSVLFTFSDDVTLEQQLRSIQNLITVKTEDDRLLLLRFYSPKTFLKLVSGSHDIEHDRFCGLSTSIQTSPLAHSASGLVMENAAITKSITPITIRNELAQVLLS